MAYKYIISKSLDPIFAIAIGTAAAWTRISREENEKGRDMTKTIEVVKRRVDIAWNGAGGRSRKGKEEDHEEGKAWEG
ncbi:uncharacterized protein BDR25DRAFT_271715 [Lindgomyces ingoldianus]|uniref:Uncharacterized protein n=1 Tax=Lindgomyces ingoldianus TaxID=673940 RepID=A0ACB6QDH7_9PLEO|nr:uncharacterized protein BDR25DRAFT_271715 [Lindgomyces ingoldianus]KAF2464663.1 hypothetical protein BDR25DRAFT_271715 [Lindgomyces ingoldianus]